MASAGGGRHRQIVCRDRCPQRFHCNACRRFVGVMFVGDIEPSVTAADPGYRVGIVGVVIVSTADGDI